MSLETLFDNLASILDDKNNKDSDPNLKQGQKFLYYENEYNNIVPDLGLIEQTSSPNLGSIIEALEGQDSLHGKTKSNTEALTNIEKEFSKTLNEYTSTYKLFSEELLQKSQSQKDVSKYYGKVLTDNDGDHKYVNDYGVTHRYSISAWEANNKSCPSEPVPITDNQSELLQQGPDMGIGQACKIAGKNIRNSTTDEVAWIDIKGYKHVYSDEAWKSKQESCNIEPIALDSKSYDTIPAGGNMTKTSVCEQIDVNPKVWQKMIKLNDKLMTLASELDKEMDKLSGEDVRLKKSIAEKKKEVSKHVNTLSQDRSSLNEVNARITTLSGEEEDASLVLKSTYYMYLVWILVAITIIAITAHNITTSNTSILANVIVVIFLVVMVYTGIVYLSNKY